MATTPPLAFWFVHTTIDGKWTPFAVAAHTERSARLQVRRHSKTAVVSEASMVKYPHAWRIMIAGDR